METGTNNKHKPGGCLFDEQLVLLQPLCKLREIHRIQPQSARVFPGKQNINLLPQYRDAKLPSVQETYPRLFQRHADTDLLYRSVGGLLGVLHFAKPDPGSAGTVGLGRNGLRTGARIYGAGQPCIHIPQHALCSRYHNRSGDLHPMLWTFGQNPFNAPAVFVGFRLFQRPLPLCLRRAHHELSGRDQRELHADTPSATATVPWLPTGATPARGKTAGSSLR